MHDFQGLLITLSLFCGVLSMPAAQSQDESVVTTFVQREGSRLVLNNRTWTFAGCNMYWLGVDENCEPQLPPNSSVGGGCIHYPSFFRIRDAMITAKGLGLNVVRAHTLGVSSGMASDGLALHPSLNHFNDQAFETIDYAINQAKMNGIRLIVPLTDNWMYYHGGYHDFTGWRGLDCDTKGHGVPDPSNPCYQFFTNQTIIQDFRAYVSHLMSHVNSLTGIALKDEPTILAWETGNELQEKGQPFANWTNSLAGFIKNEIGAKQLIMDGRAEGTIGIDQAALANPNVDIMTDHFYTSWSDAIAVIKSHAPAVAQANKVYTIGEYGAAKSDAVEITPFLDVIEQLDDTHGHPLVAGDAWWSFFGHGSNYGFVEHGDTYTLHYPGETRRHMQLVDRLRQHAFVKRGLAWPQPLPAPQTPNITFVAEHKLNASCSHVQIAWQGAAMACNYSVQRQVNSDSWKDVCSACATDLDTPWWDNSTLCHQQALPPSTAFAPTVASLRYRVAGVSCSGTAGNWSEPFPVPRA